MLTRFALSSSRSYLRRPAALCRWGVALSLGAMVACAREPLPVSPPANPAAPVAETAAVPNPTADNRDCPPARPVARAIAQAQVAAERSQTATSAADWNAAAVAWLQAIAALRAVPLDSPQRAFADKKAIEYERNLAVAQQQAAAAPAPLPFASFGSELLDEQLRLFLSSTAALGPPEVLIVGSSRALQGIDPRQLQASRSQQGQPGLRIFNFGVNGATAQTVDLLVREVLSAEQLPALILWADGARALNSGRPDRTYQAIAASPGYTALQQGRRPTLPVPPVDPNCPPEQSSTPDAARAKRLGRSLARWASWAQPAQAVDVQAIDAFGFLAAGDRFDPDTYYNRFPRVAGRYDSDYQALNFGGEQQAALARLSEYARSRQVALVFVNLPLSADYLDETRSAAERDFRQFMQQQATQLGFRFIDWGEQWRDRPELFADPSHLNRFGAAQIAIQLASDGRTPWELVGARSRPTPSPVPPASPTPTITLPPPP